MKTKGSTILQSEASECGLACIAIVANTHGMGIGISELRRRFPGSLKGTKLSTLISIAQRLGLSARPLRLEIEDIDSLELPCVLHWDLNHFVVLVRVKRRHVVVLDPAWGERTLSFQELSKHFTGVALELTPTAEFRRQESTPELTARQLVGPMRGLWSALGHILVLSTALQVFLVLSPFLMQWVVDHVLVSANEDLLSVLGLGFGLALVLQTGIGLLRGLAILHLSSSLGVQWMGNVFAHLMRLPLEFFEKRHLGDITSRISSVQAFQKVLTTSFVEAFIDGMMALVTFALMLAYSWKLALITVLAVFFYLGLRAVAFGSVRDRTEQQLVAAARQQSHLLESLRGIQSIKVAGKEGHRRSTYSNLMNDTVNHDVKLARIGLGFNSASQFVFGVERIVVIWIGALLALKGAFSVGMLIAYLAYKDQFAQRMSALIDKWIEFRMLRLHGARLSDIVLTEPQSESVHHSFPLSDTRIEIENVSFRYAENEPWVLRECSFVIEPGTSMAIVGASGTGKTTLMKLMLGVLQPTAGSVRIGGQDVRYGVPESVRSLMGAVMQDDQLFAGTIADNISFFDEEIDVTRIETAARLAGVHDEIVDMPMGYHSLIGDMGSLLSGGQKQRVVLARALYRDPKLLFLDEATSHLDVSKERQVNDAVKALNLTRIIVAHRPETIASADQVLTLNEGRIAWGRSESQ